VYVVTDLKNPLHIFETHSSLLYLGLNMIKTSMGRGDNTPGVIGFRSLTADITVVFDTDDIHWDLDPTHLFAVVNKPSFLIHPVS
jgi:hypothetical protein